MDKAEIGQPIEIQFGVVVYFVGLNQRDDEQLLLGDDQVVADVSAYLL